MASGGGLATPSTQPRGCRHLVTHNPLLVPDIVRIVPNSLKCQVYVYCVSVQLIHCTEPKGANRHHLYVSIFAVSRYLLRNKSGGLYGAVQASHLITPPCTMQLRKQSMETSLRKKMHAQLRHTVGDCEATLIPCLIGTEKCQHRISGSSSSSSASDPILHPQFPQSCINHPLPSNVGTSHLTPHVCVCPVRTCTQ